MFLIILDQSFDEMSIIPPPNGIKLMITKNDNFIKNANIWD